MSPWTFVFGAYWVAISLTSGLLGWAFAFMRRAENAADALKRK